MDFTVIANTIIEAAQQSWAALSMFWAWFVVHIWPFVWEWVIIGILYKAIFAHWAADQIMKWSKRRLIQSKEQLALWFHFRDRAMKRGHEADPAVCMDGLCGEVNALKLKTAIQVPKVPID